MGIKSAVFPCLFSLFPFLACHHNPSLTGDPLKEALRRAVNDSAAVNFSADPDEAAAAIRTILSEKPPARTGQDTLFIPCADGKERALGLHVPAGYAPGRPLPLILWLHGGVNGMKPDRGAEVAHYFARESDSLSFFFAALSGERGATWFDPVGRENIARSIRLLKTRYDVDDDRVILAGVSDGGTGCYVTGMYDPDVFAGFAVFSASPLMLPTLGFPLMPVNMRLRTWLVAHGGRDDHYPAAGVRRAVEYFQSLGARMAFHLYDTAGHGLDFMPLEKSAVMDFFLTARRDPSPRDIEFECTGPFQLAWIGTDSVSGTPARPAYVRAGYAGDTLRITARQVRRLSLYPAPPAFTPGRTLTVLINSQDAVRRTAHEDLPWMVREARRSRDRSFLPFCRLEFNVND